MGPRKALELEEQRQFTRLATIASERDPEQSKAGTIDAYGRLFEIYTDMLKLNAADKDALKQAYRVCCLWEPTLNEKQKQSLFSLYQDVASSIGILGDEQKLNFFRAHRILTAIWPDHVSTIDKSTQADRTYSMIYSETKKMAAFAANRIIDQRLGAEAMCLFADNAMQKLSRTREASRKQFLVQEAFQGYNTALSFASNEDSTSVDALIGLFVLTRKKEHIERAKRINAAEVNRATFGQT